jgi:hypothetical protein
MKRNNNTKDNSFALFKNPQWTEGSNVPMYKGTGNWQGEEINLSCWLREASGEGKLEAGTKFFSGAIDQWQPKPQGNRPQQSEAPMASEDIPF